MNPCLALARGGPWASRGRLAFDEGAIVSTALPPAGDLQPLPLNIEEELKESYLNYAMSVIISRALPDVRDGLKPSQRRILMAMLDLGLTAGGATSKCARIVGERSSRRAFKSQHAISTAEIAEAAMPCRPRFRTACLIAT